MSVRNILQVGERVLFNACSLVVVCYVKFKNISNTFGRIAVSQDSFHSGDCAGVSSDRSKSFNAKSLARQASICTIK